MLVCIPGPPHGPVRLVTIAKPSVQIVRVTRKLPKVPISSVFGPRAPPTTWESTLHALIVSFQTQWSPIIGNKVVLPPITLGDAQESGFAGLSNSFDEVTRASHAGLGRLAVPGR